MNRLSKGLVIGGGLLAAVAAGVVTSKSHRNFERYVSDRQTSQECATAVEALSELGGEFWDACRGRSDKTPEDVVAKRKELGEQNPGLHTGWQKWYCSNGERGPAMVRGDAYVTANSGDRVRKTATDVITYPVGKDHMKDVVRDFSSCRVYDGNFFSYLIE